MGSEIWIDGVESRKEYENGNDANRL
jgi:hypothetical protein